MRLTINIEKRYAFAIIGALVLVAGLLGVVAVSDGITKPNPGHTVYETSGAARNIEVWGAGEQSGECDRIYDYYVAENTGAVIPSVDYVCGAGWARTANYALTAGSCTDCGNTQTLQAQWFDSPTYTCPTGWVSTDLRDGDGDDGHVVNEDSGSGSPQVLCLRLV